MPSHCKGATGRNFAEEYAARKRRGLARGLTLPQLRGHASKSEPSVSVLRTSGLIGGDSKAEALLRRKYAAVARMRLGESLSSAAKAKGISPSTLRRFVNERQPAAAIYSYKNGRPTRIKEYVFGGGGSPVILTSDGQVVEPEVDRRTASLLGRYWNDVDDALRGDERALDKYRNTVVYTLDGKAHRLMSDVNDLRAWLAVNFPDGADAFWRTPHNQPHSETSKNGRRCAICGGDGPFERHHVAGKRQCSWLILHVCIACHRPLTLRQKRWVYRDRHPVYCIVQGCFDVLAIWRERSPFFGPMRDLLTMLVQAAFAVLAFLRLDALCEIALVQHAAPYDEGDDQ
jgi:hypothetical protein